MEDLKKEEQKEIVKEAIKEWCDDKFLSFGKYTAKGLAVACFGALLYFLFTNGWIAKP